jgi:hypothetical protein
MLDRYCCEIFKFANEYLHCENTNFALGMDVVKLRQIAEPKWIMVYLDSLASEYLFKKNV